MCVTRDCFLCWVACVLVVVVWWLFLLLLLFVAFWNPIYRRQLGHPFLGTWRSSLFFLVLRVRGIRSPTAPNGSWKPFNGSLSRWTQYERLSEPPNRPMNRWTGRWTVERINELLKRSMNRWTAPWNRRTDQLSRWTHQRTVERLYETVGWLVN